MSIKYKKEFHSAYDELVLIMDEIGNMIEKPENEYDKGFNRACKVILQDILGPFNYRMEVRLENEYEWLDPDYNYEDSKETKTKTKKLAVVKKQQS
jgi:hypothetical protein